MKDSKDSNEGVRLLRASGASLRTIARATRASHEAARKWLAGVTVPGAEYRERLLVEYGIPVASWDLAAEDGRAARRDAPPVTGPEPSGDTEADLALELDGPDAAKAAAAAHLRRVRRLRAELEARGGSALELARAGELERRAILDFGRFNGELVPADEARLTQTPRFRAIVAAISEELVRYPEAARAVAARLREMV